MKITGAKIYTKNFLFEDKELYVFKDRITENEDLTAKEIVYQDCYIIPGLTDVHFHGCMDADFCDGNEESIHKIAKYQASVGVTQICPATMTLPIEELEQIMSTAKSFKKEKNEATLCGINMEGPFLSVDKKGAQNASYICKANEEIFDSLQELSGNLIKLLDIAPEETDLSFLQKMKEKVVLSFAHSMADYEVARAGYLAGITHLTHLFNAMLPINHRKPGPIVAAAEENCEVEIICDGVHLHPAIIRMVFKLFSEDKIIFISDSMRACGMKDGNYTLGGQAVKVKGNEAHLSDGTIAGSVTHLLDCMRYAVREVGIPIEIAVRCATMNPASSIGIQKDYGSLEEGKYANFLVLDKELNLIDVYVEGVKIDR